MEKIKKSNENFDKIKVFSSDDEKLKLLGELLSNKSSRDIIKLLIDKEMYTNEIVKKLELKVSLVIHHLQKMESIGLLEITNKKITRNGENHRFFRIPTGMLILPNESKEITDNGFFKGIFKTSMKFVAIGITSLISFLALTPHRQNVGSVVLDIPEKDLIEKISEIDPLIFSLLIIIVGLIIERIFSKKRKKEY